MFSTCRCPKRAPGTDPGLPTRGTGDYEWRGFLKASQHPQQAKRNGVILNWNNLPAPGLGAADDEWGFGSVHRVELFERASRSAASTPLASLVGVMNLGATQDHRAAVVLDAPIAGARHRAGAERHAQRRCWRSSRTGAPRARAASTPTSTA